MNLQPSDLINDWAELIPLSYIDFEILYDIAKDPLIWEQHPNPDRYQRDIFLTYFKGALESNGAFLIKDLEGNVIGCTRFYDYFEEKREIKIGYTFFARHCWGKPFNKSVKTLMLEYAFRFVDVVVFHVGAGNIRSQKAMVNIGAKLIGEETVSYYGEAPKINKVYWIEKSDFDKKQVLF